VRTTAAAIACLAVLAGCKQEAHPPKAEKVAVVSPPPVIETPKESDPAFSGECAGLEAYPWPRSYRQILADAPRGARNDRFTPAAVFVIGPDGNVTHLRFLHLSTLDSVNQSLIAFVKRQHYKPTVLDGKRVAICSTCSTMSINVDFSQ
jgi:hypothetical protein